ncbi:MAG: hypothetical protein U5J97_03940 [Trueperaceae bacterium]|nr:hypothetical protein [Trueperaceae bacterium]
MKRVVHGSILILASVLLLGACSGIPGLGGVDVEVGFTPTSLGFEVDDEGKITVASHTVVFSSAPGSSAAVATGFDVTYYDQDGDPFFGTVAASTFTNRDAFAHPIPAGLVCVESVPCRATSPDASFARVQSEPLANVVTLPGAIAVELLARGDGAGYADFTVYVTSDGGGDVELPVRVQFTYPVGGGG